MSPLFFTVWLAFFAVAVLGGIFWIFKIIEVVGISEHQFRVAGTEKLTWVLVVVLAGQIGALVWHFGKRSQVLGAAGAVPYAPPGWYPERGTSSMRWWDGARWTEYQHGASPP
ncbi:MAG TPA: DUF2510 domain-containing protein [Acidimicrobiales bacterium]